MTYGESNYEQYLKEFKKRKGNTRGALTRQAWETYRQMKMEGKAPADIDVAAKKVGLTPSPMTKGIRERQTAQRSLLDFLNRLRGMGR